MSFLIGLTGSIGMGKSTTAKMFVEEGCALWDADAAVHRIYEAGGAAVGPMQEAFPDAIIDGAVSREVLKAIIGKNPAALKAVEQIVHPLLAQDRATFLAEAETDILVFDTPLLFETGGDLAMNATVVASVDEETQRQRVLARGTMTEAQFEAIKAKQMPDAEKRAKADYVVTTDTMENAAEQVREIVAMIRAELSDA